MYKKGERESGRDNPAADIPRRAHAATTILAFSPLPRLYIYRERERERESLSLLSSASFFGLSPTVVMVVVMAEA